MLAPASCAVTCGSCGYPETMARLLFDLYDGNEGPVGKTGGDVEEGWILGSLDMSSCTAIFFLLNPEDFVSPSSH